MSFNLAEQVRGAVGEASIAVMGSSSAPAERNIATITAEIQDYKSQGGEVLLEIGKRLCEAKAMLDHGEWLKWLAEEVDFSERSAQELMRIARQFPNPRALADLGKTKVLKLLLLPEGERDSFVETHDVANMSTRELEQAIRERDEARKAAEILSEQVKALEESNTDLETKALDYSNQNDDLKERIRALESAPKEVYQDEAAIQKAAEEARKAAEAEWRAKVQAAEAKLAKAEDKARKAAEKSKSAEADAGKAAAGELEAAKAEAEKARAEAEKLRSELEAAKRTQTKAVVSGDADLAAFQLLFEAARENVNKMRGLLLKVRGREDKTLGEKLTAALTTFAEKVKECAK